MPRVGCIARIQDADPFHNHHLHDTTVDHWTMLYALGNDEDVTLSKYNLVTIHALEFDSQNSTQHIEHFVRLLFLLDSPELRYHP